MSQANGSEPIASAKNPPARPEPASLGGVRGGSVREITEIVRDVANGEQPNPFDDGLPGG
jgi:hypothetical protein